MSFFDDFQGETTMPGATPLGVPEAVAAKFEAKPKNKKGWLAGGIGLGLVALLAIAAGASSLNSSDSGSSSGSSDAYSWSYQQCYDALDQNPYEVGQLTEYEGVAAYMQGYQLTHPQSDWADAGAGCRDGFEKRISAGQ